MVAFLVRTFVVGRASKQILNGAIVLVVMSHFPALGIGEQAASGRELKPQHVGGHRVLIETQCLLKKVLTIA